MRLHQERAQKWSKKCKKVALRSQNKKKKNITRQWSDRPHMNASGCAGNTVTVMKEKYCDTLQSCLLSPPRSPHRPVVLDGHQNISRLKINVVHSSRRTFKVQDYHIQSHNLCLIGQPMCESFMGVFALFRAGFSPREKPCKSTAVNMEAVLILPDEFFLKITTHSHSEHQHLQTRLRAMCLQTLEAPVDLLRNWQKIKKIVNEKKGNQ